MRQMGAPTACLSVREHARMISGSWASRRARYEDARFFHQQADRCYQLAWQSSDLRVAQKLNLAGNEHTAKARELRSQETNGTPDEETGRSKKHQ